MPKDLRVIVPWRKKGHAGGANVAEKNFS